MSHIAEPVQVNNSPSIQAVVDQDAKTAAVTAREDRLLATRQRNTLLTIIAALCEYSVLRRYNTEIHRIVGRNRSCNPRISSRFFMATLDIILNTVREAFPELEEQIKKIHS
jgi:hypothetical protein